MNDLTDVRMIAQSIALDDSERQRCEIWTRVMGYHRPVASFNIGKKGEHYERRFFRETRAQLGDTC
jgi:hypothetical protein